MSRKKRSEEVNADADFDVNETCSVFRVYCLSIVSEWGGCHPDGWGRPQDRIVNICNSDYVHNEQSIYGPKENS